LVFTLISKYFRQAPNNTFLPTKASLKLVNATSPVTRHLHAGIYPYKSDLSTFSNSVSTLEHLKNVKGNGPMGDIHSKGKRQINLNQLQTENLRVIEAGNLNGVDISAATIPSLSFKTMLFSTIVSFKNEDPQKTYTIANLLRHFYETIQSSNVLDASDKFISTDENREKVFNLLLAQDYPILIEKHLQNALYAILADAPDKIYRANYEWKSPNGEIAFVSTYSNGIEQRMVEAAYVCAQAIKRGQYPFLVHGEGMANIKETPFDCIVNGKKQTLTWTYRSSRAGNEEISLINDVLRQTDQSTILPFELKPQQGKEEAFYHQDCVAIFYYDNSTPSKAPVILHSTEDINYTDIVGHYGKNGIAVIAKDGLDDRSLAMINRTHEIVIELDCTNDPLMANVVLTKGKEGPVCFVSDKISQEDERKLEFAGIHVIKWSNVAEAGAGGIQCQNSIQGTISSPLSIDKWLDKHTELGVPLPSPLFVEAVAELLDQKNSFSPPTNDDGKPDSGPALKNFIPKVEIKELIYASSTTQQYG
tara:strand:+ start:3732 stop:5330 length:1599 start_codon:yes stop_codon:yes gene_type:complete